MCQCARSQTYEYLFLSDHGKRKPSQPAYLRDVLVISKMLALLLIFYIVPPGHRFECLFDLLVIEKSDLININPFMTLELHLKRLKTYLQFELVSYLSS